MNLQDIQERLPWAIPYSDGFYASQEREGHRYLTHDILHVMKSLGRVAALAEKCDHNFHPGMTREQLANEVADLVICALHIAKNNPLGAFDLEAAVLQSLDRRNGSSLSPTLETRCDGLGLDSERAYQVAEACRKQETGIDHE